MSRLRLSTPGQPTAFIDLGPSVVIRHGNGIEAEPIGHMRPILAHGAYLENRARVKVPQAFSIHIENRRDVCGYLMPRLGVQCARMPGHRDCHRSADLMKTDRIVRRAVKP